MNALSGKFTCAVLLTSDPSAVGSSTKVSVGVQNIAVVLQHQENDIPLIESVASHIQRFCAIHNISCVDCGRDIASLLKESAHVVVVRCEDRAATGEVSTQLLQQTSEPIVIVLEIDCSSPSKWDIRDSESNSGWKWLQPTPSCLAELQKHGGCSSGVWLQAAMRCSKPVVRVQLPPSPQTSVPWASAVTLDGLMREVGYKVGCLPKYGS